MNQFESALRELVGATDATTRGGDLDLLPVSLAARLRYGMALTTARNVLAGRPVSLVNAKVLKTDPEVFEAVFTGKKTHEIRFNDRDFHEGDILLLKETVCTGQQMRNGAPLEFTGRELSFEVTHVLAGYGLMPGWVILSLGPVMPIADTAKVRTAPQAGA